MKFLFTGALIASLAVLAGCGTPAANSNGAFDDRVASNAPTFEDKGEVLTGSRIPQKSTTHVLKRVGSAEYKKARNDAGGGSVPDAAAAWGPDPSRAR